MAAPATDLKKVIIKNARDLFTENGYAGTSIKQIAKASGCTTAALYYYFEEGKGHILREVIRSYTFEALDMVGEDTHYETLHDFLQDFAKMVSITMPRMLSRMHWLMPEITSIPLEDRNHIMGFFLRLQAGVQRNVARFVPEDEAHLLAWIIVCAYSGYGQMFYRMGLQPEVPVSPEAFGAALARLSCQE